MEKSVNDIPSFFFNFEGHEEEIDYIISLLTKDVVKPGDDLIEGAISVYRCFTSNNIKNVQVGTLGTLSFWRMF